VEISPLVYTDARAAASSDVARENGFMPTDWTP